ncbi:NUDIX hydrolase [Oceanobacillus jordanicus]|uniref:NUDIX hydrolase n=1 Tax=Oceanobacillus jordanicus TaxID=2867266 RepID=A0AAW5B6I9_9BACI|nr:NUDIX hydrolase [Oceanobacillus jordanicus]
MNRWKTLHTEYIYKTPFGNLRKDKCELPNGFLIDEYYVQEHADWVNAVVLLKDREIVLVKQYRHAGEDFFLEIPAGKPESNESNEEGIVREIREETGFITEKQPIKLAEFMVNPATQTNKITTYLLLDAHKEFDQDLDCTEDIKVTTVGFEEVGHLIRTNQIKTQLFTARAYFMAKDFLSD